MLQERELQERVNIDQGASCQSVCVCDAAASNVVHRNALPPALPFCGAGDVFLLCAGQAARHFRVRLYQDKKTRDKRLKDKKTRRQETRR